ncbi:MAG TPA: hypothetical protein VNS58_09100 [Puia sp.]|nr:hypothetical protein [Puia sp.]
MAYQISRLDLRSIDSRAYLFDTNIWLLVLGIQTDPKGSDLKYMQFFEEVFNAAKQGKATILLPALMVGEIVNRYILNVEMVKFARSKGEDVRSPNYFKLKFRPAPEYKAAKAKIYDDLCIYQIGCQLINDNFGSPGFGYGDLLDGKNVALDFGDNYFYQLALHHHAILVTHDADFFLENIPIYTLNHQLIEKANAALVPKK